MIRLAIALLALTGGACASGQSSPSPDAPGRSTLELARLTDPVRRLHRAQENTGFVLAVSLAGRVVLEDYAGLAVVEHDVPITASSRFPIMSITKAFTGAALARAVSDGLIELDRPVREYLPDYAGEGADIITVRMLATHTSGIPHRRHPERQALYVRHFATAAETVEAFVDLPLTAPPGTAYAYSSSGYNLLAAIIERVAGIPFTAYVKKEILDPLGLSSTNFGDVMRPVAGLVRNYSFVDIWSYAPGDTLQLVPTWDFSYNVGGGNMTSTVGDLLTLGNALLRGDAFSASERVLLTQPLVTGDPSSPWAAGWIVGEDAAGRRNFHITGATPGVQASLYVYPEQDLVFAMLANGWGKGSAGGALVIDAPMEIVDRLLAEKDGDRGAVDGG